MEKQQAHQNRTHNLSRDEIHAFCADLLNGLQLDLTHECKEDEGVIHINITGKDRTFLLTSSASLLNSLEYLINKIFPGTREEAPGIMLDSDHYRKHRELELKLLAEMASKKVISMKKPLTLQPMIPRERRIIHLALVEIEGVRSKSEGDGDNRSIIIYPSE
jgi:spoIIIJ-associated protein